MATKHRSSVPSGVETVRDALQRHPPKPCAVRGCPSGRRRLGPWCTRHESRLRYAGHPTFRPPSRRFRRKLCGYVREILGTAADASKLPDELLAFLDDRRRLLKHWSTRLTHEWEVEAAGRLARVDSLDLLAIVTAFELYWDEYIDMKALRRDVEPGWMTVEREQRMKTRQLRGWLNDLDAFKGFPSRKPSCRDAMVRVVGMLTAYRSPSTLSQVAFVLAQKVAPRVRERVVELQQEQSRRARAAMEGWKRELYPHGVEADGRVYIYRDQHENDEEKER